MWGWFFTWPGIMVPVNVLNVWIAWAYLELLYGEGEVYCWDEVNEALGGLIYYCNVYGRM